MRWKSFKIGDVLEFKSSNGIFHACNVNIEDTKTEVNHPYVVRTSQNNGIRGYISADEKALNPANTISFAQDTAQMFYQNEPYFTGNKVKIVSAKKYILTKEIALFLITCMNKTFSNFTWGSSYNTKLLEKAIISLPITENEEIDWNYMQERITELEQERITELEQYLIVTGLNDYELTNEDKEILATKLRNGGILQSSTSGNGYLKEARMFKIGDLFEGQTGDVDLQQKDVNGKGTYFINSGIENNGVKGKTDKQAKIFSANTISIDFWGNAYYRDFEYKMATHNHVFSLSGDCIKNQKVGLYLVTQMSYMRTLFSYSNMGTWNKIKELFILLPIQIGENNKPIISMCKKYHPDGYIPDWSFMEKYIRAIEKEVIKDVVEFKDEIIKQTNNVIN